MSDTYYVSCIVCGIEMPEQMAYYKDGWYFCDKHFPEDEE